MIWYWIANWFVFLGEDHLSHSQRSSVTYSSLWRFKTSWSFSIHVLPSVGAVLAQLMFEQSHWWDLMVIASDTTRRSDLTCCECCDLGWIWNVVFSLDKFCFLDHSPLWVLVKLFYFLWRTFFPWDSVGALFSSAVEVRMGGTFRRGVFSCWTYPSWLCTCEVYGIATRFFSFSLLYYARGNKKEALCFKIIDIFHTESWFGFEVNFLL